MATPHYERTEDRMKVDVTPEKLDELAEEVTEEETKEEREKALSQALMGLGAEAGVQVARANILRGIAQFRERNELNAVTELERGNAVFTRVLGILAEDKQDWGTEGEGPVLVNALANAMGPLYHLCMELPVDQDTQHQIWGTAVACYLMAVYRLGVIDGGKGGEK